MPLTRQCKDTFIRNFGEYGYLKNQLSKHDRIYDNIGRIFLNTLSRNPQNIEEIVNKLHIIFSDIELNTLRSDYLEFISDLERDKYVVVSNTEAELDSKEPNFSYKSENPKTATRSFLEADRNFGMLDTSDFL